MSPLNYLVAWLSIIPWWQTLIVYFFCAVFFGTINKRIQRWRCNQATDCGRWDEGFCSHVFSGIVGYALWPLFLPMTILYTIAESEKFSMLFKTKQKN